MKWSHKIILECITGSSFISPQYHLNSQPSKSYSGKDSDSEWGKIRFFFFPCSILPKLVVLLLVFLPEFWASQVWLNLATNPPPADYLSSASIVLNLNQSWIWQKKYLNCKGKYSGTFYIAAASWPTICPYFNSVRKSLQPWTKLPTWRPFWGITPDRLFSQHWHCSVSITHIPLIFSDNYWGIWLFSRKISQQSFGQVCP